MKSLSDLAAAAGDLPVIGNPSTCITGIGYDSREVRPGDLFVALRGGYYDGHNFVGEALERGAAAVLVERRPEADCAAILAPDTRATLPLIAATFYDHPSQELNVVGVTGTDGKTTTTYLIDAVFRAAGHATGLLGTVAVRIRDVVVEHETRQTTPESVTIQRYLREMADAGVQWVILEATSHGLDLHRLDAVRFAIGAVTNVTHEHLDYHGTIEAYRRAKGILFERVAERAGTVVVNLDDEGACDLLRFAAGADVITYSVERADATVSAEVMTIDVGGSRFRLRTPIGEALVHLPLLGAFNIANALCAAGVAVAAGVPLTDIAEALSSAPPIPGRLQRIDAGQPFTVVVDYAHTPESLAKVLELLRALNPGGRCIAVFGSAGERDTAKRPLQGAVAARLADVSIFTTEDPRFEDPDKIIAEIAAGAERAGGIEGRSFHRVTDRAAAVRQALALVRPGDCVLLAGKGHERSIIWGHEKRPWDEAAVAREALADLGYRGGG